MYEVSHVLANFQKNPRNAALQNWPIPKGVCDRIHIDLLGPVKGKHAFIITNE
ncbi:hypothetical protein QE152_g19044 [Popillia japonica]|uniref:Uncharacterized protein n=1 Tax=Popillia japonica TaxID=7064 RepID=A0AAW1KYS3_POPJA